MHGDHQYSLCVNFSINGDAFLSANRSLKLTKEYYKLIHVILSL